jgi:predicted ATP-grasp superfamily ATP-dependent carboligase
MCELPFLMDHNGQWRLLELNPRPWLQVGLAAAAGVPLAVMTCSVLKGGAVEAIQPRDGLNWVNIERMLIAALSGEQGNRLRALVKAGHACRRAEAVAVYGSHLPHVKLRWLRRMAHKALDRIWP